MCNRLRTPFQVRAMRTGCVVLLAALIGPGPALRAQDASAPRRIFTAEAIERAVAGLPISDAAPQDSRSDWSGLSRLVDAEVIIDSAGQPSRRSRIVAVDETAMTVIDLDSSSRATLRIPRADVAAVRQWTGRRGSRLGAVIGAGAGAFLGFVTSLNLALRQCGASCNDERVLIGVSLVGMPIAGGLLGYYLPGGNRALTTVYVRP